MKALGRNEMSSIPSQLDTVANCKLLVRRWVGQLRDGWGRAFIVVYGPNGREEVTGPHNTKIPVST